MLKTGHSLSLFLFFFTCCIRAISGANQLQATGLGATSILARTTSRITENTTCPSNWIRRIESAMGRQNTGRAADLKG